MKMSFQAVIKDLECRQIWCKSIASLSTVSEALKFIITSKYVSVSSLNTAMTCSFEAFFSRHFFDSFTFVINDLNSINHDGFTFLSHNGEQNNDTESDPSTYNLPQEKNACFSFIIPSKYLSIIFKNMENELGCEYVMSVNFLKKCPKTHRYKLLVEKISNRRIKKQFSPSFQPIQLKIFSKNISDFSNHYKSRLKNLYDGFEFDEENDDFILPLEKIRHVNHGKLFSNSRWFEDDYDEKSLNYLNIENHILKKFLENSPSAVEDFQININRVHDRVNFFSFLKPIKKDNKIYIRQPMSLCVSMLFQDIIDMFFYGGANPSQDLDEKSPIKITFRLKEMRTFINLISYPFTDSPDDAGSRKYLKGLNNMNDDTINGNGANITQKYSLIDNNKGDFEVFFEEEGSPIVFESFLKRGLVKLRLTQITDIDGTNNHFENSENSKTETTIAIPTTHNYQKKLLPDYKVVKNRIKKIESQDKDDSLENDRVLEKQILDLLEKDSNTVSANENVQQTNQLFIDNQDLHEYITEKHLTTTHTDNLTGVNNTNDTNNIVGGFEVQNKITQKLNVTDSNKNDSSCEPISSNRIKNKAKGSKLVTLNYEQSILSYTNKAVTHDAQFNDNQFYELGESLVNKPQEVELFEPTITWNTANSQDHLVSNKRKLVTEDESKESSVIYVEQKNTEQGNESENVESERIGRTQEVKRFKGIFD